MDRWYRGKNFDEEITSELDSRYTVTNGKLIFQNPEEGPDANIYRCTAENVLGLVISNEVQLTFGRESCLLVGWLAAERPSNMLVYLRDGSAQTIVRAATLR